MRSVESHRDTQLNYLILPAGRSTIKPLVRLWSRLFCRLCLVIRRWQTVW